MTLSPQVISLFTEQPDSVLIRPFPGLVPELWVTEQVFSSFTEQVFSSFTDPDSIVEFILLCLGQTQRQTSLNPHTDLIVVEDTIIGTVHIQPNDLGGMIISLPHDESVTS